MAKGSQPLPNTRCYIWAKPSPGEQISPKYVQNEWVTHCSQEVRGSPSWQLHVSSYFPSQSHPKLKGELPGPPPFSDLQSQLQQSPRPLDSAFQPNAILRDWWTTRNSAAKEKSTGSRWQLQRLCTFKYWAHGQEHGLYKHFSLIKCVPNLPLKGVLQVKYLPDSWDTSVLLPQISSIVTQLITSQTSRFIFHMYLLNRLLISCQWE